MSEEIKFKPKKVKSLRVRKVSSDDEKVDDQTNEETL